MVADILQMSLLLLAVMSKLEAIDALRCWQCIADNCHTDPSENYKATEKDCQQGGYCQKVIYSDRYNNHTNTVSVVRSCSKRCESKDNYSNCTWSKRGCVTRLCCKDSDLCNGGESSRFPWRLLYVLVVDFLFVIRLEGSWIF